MLTVGLIGCGGMGNMHLNCYLALKDKVKVVAVADVVESKREAFAKRAEAKSYASAQELLDNETPDIIDICLPTFLHAEYGIKAMEKGCNLFIEKPICLTDEEANLLLETQKKTGAKVQVGQVVRFMDGYKYLKNVIEDGTYGKVVTGVFERLSANPKWAWENWFNDPERSGTAALDLHVHDTDFIRYIMGEPDSIESEGVRDENGVLTHIFTKYKYGKTVISAEGGWDFPDCYPFAAQYRVMLEKATIELQKGKVTVYPVGDKAFEPEFGSDNDINVDSGINVSSLGGYFNEINYFIDQIVLGNGKEIAPLSEGVKSAQLVRKEIEAVGGKVIK